MGCPRQEYRSGLPFSFRGDLPDPGIELGSPALQADSLPTEPPGKPYLRSAWLLKCGDFPQALINQQTKTFRKKEWEKVNWQRIEGDQTAQGPALQIKTPIKGASREAPQ